MVKYLLFTFSFQAFQRSRKARSLDLYMVKIFGMAGICDTLFIIKHVKMMELKFVAHCPYLGFEKQVVTLIQGFKSCLVLYVSLLRNWKDNICKIFWLWRIHFNEDAHKVVVTEHREIFVFCFGINIVSIPAHNVILV